MVKEDVDIGREQLRVTGVGGESKKGGGGGGKRMGIVEGEENDNGEDINRW